MNKKPCVSPVQSFQINTDIETGDLPNLATVQETVALVTGKAAAASQKTAKPRIAQAEKAIKPIIAAPITSIERVVERVKYGRPVKSTAVGREKFTTMLQPELIRSLKRTAIDKAVTVADLLEELIANNLFVK